MHRRQRPRSLHAVSKRYYVVLSLEVSHTIPSRVGGQGLSEALLGHVTGIDSNDSFQHLEVLDSITGVISTG